MEDSQLEHRIRIFQYIQEAWRDSGNSRSLVDILADHTFGMTRDELEDFLKNSIAPKLEQAWRDLDASNARVEELREEAEREREARRKAESEIERLKKAAEDAKNTKATDNRDKYDKRSRKSRHAVDKDFAKTDRRQEKEDFDGKADKDTSEATQAVITLEEGKKFLTQRELDARQQRIGSNYTMADASGKVVYECDVDNIPEGWERCDEKIYEETCFDTKTTIRARRVKFIKVRRRAVRTLEDGTEEEYRETERIHIPLKGSHLRKDLGLPGSDGEAEEEPFTTDNVPGRIPGTSSTPAMAAKILLDLHVCVIPVNRMANVFGQFGFSKGRQGLINWIWKYADLMKPAYELLQDTVLKDNSVIFCDETWQRLHLNSGTRKVYEWIIGNKKEKATFYHYDDGSRGRKVIAELLEGRRIKAVHTDGYNAYIFLEGTGVVHITCTAHIWRYIMDWYNATKDDDARMLLTEISALYIIESEIRGKSQEEIIERRQSVEVTEILTRYKARLDTLNMRIDSLPKIARKAVNYALSQYPKMSRWREDADYDIDNNFAERAAKPATLERKNRLFYCSHAGARAACIIRSFVETCRQWGVSVYDFFLNFFNAIVTGRTDYENLMPWCFATNR